MARPPTRLSTARKPPAEPVPRDVFLIPGPSPTLTLSPKPAPTPTPTPAPRPAQNAGEGPTPTPEPEPLPPSPSTPLPVIPIPRPAPPLITNLLYANANPDRDPCAICREDIGKVYTPDTAPRLPRHKHCYCYYTPTTRPASTR